MKYRIIREDEGIKVQRYDTQKYYASTGEINVGKWETITRHKVLSTAILQPKNEYTDIFENLKSAQEWVALEKMKNKINKFIVLQEFDSEKGTFRGVKNDSTEID